MWFDFHGPGSWMSWQYLNPKPQLNANLYLAHKFDILMIYPFISYILYINNFDQSVVIGVIGP